MAEQENKALIRRWIEARNKHDLQAALPLWVEGMCEQITEGFNGFSAAIPDLHVTIDDLIAEGDKVVLRWTVTGHHRGAYRGIPATGNAVSWRAIDIYTIANGKIASCVREADGLAWLKQLGVSVTWQDMIIQ